MLALFAIFGALGAGYLADAIVNMRSDDQDDDAENEDTGGPPEVSGDASSTGNLLDFGDSESVDDRLGGMPQSDDDPTPAVLDLEQTAGSGDDILSGAAGDDHLSGGAGHDQLTGRGGDDTLSGGDGSDVLDGGDGVDSLLGGEGDDTLLGGASGDRLSGDAGQDHLAGSGGDDALLGGDGSDTLLGGEGHDSLTGGHGDDWLAGGAGNDALSGGAGSDTLDGGAGNDTLFGDDSDGVTDYLNGGDGDDWLILSAGDHGHGGAGSDIFELPEIVAGDPVPTIADYLPSDDQIVVLYDADFHPEPQLALELSANGADATVILDGVPLVIVKDAAGLSVADILLHAA